MIPAASTTGLPPELDARLTDEARAAIAEAPRDQRPDHLASALSLTAEALLNELALATGLPAVALPTVATDELRTLPSRLAHDYQIIPIQAEGLKAEKNTTDSPPPAPLTDAPFSLQPLLLATPWPPDHQMVDWIATFTPRPIVWHLSLAERVRQLIVENYGVGSGSLEDTDDDLPLAAQQEADLEADADAAVVRFVTDVIAQAVTDAATDIHFEPQEEQLRIRYRVDGLLVPVPVPDNLRRYQDAIISRVKIMARLNISEKRLPQDGRINFRTGNTNLDIRVSTMPTIYAESISLRLLNQRKMAYTMEKLGMLPEEQKQIDHVLQSPHGIILVTGPTGSGKSTSLNAFLRKINSPDLRIITIEDPIEYEVPGANQIQTRAEIGLTFASVLRHTLRQDPDVIMVGEIRDLETAEIAIRASLTGHLVFSTLHTNDAPGAITRLVDMGVEPFLVASAIELVIAQRLVRRLCSDCARPRPIDPLMIRADLAAIGLEPTDADGVTQLMHPVGCQKCRGTGYRGRIGVFEIFHPKPHHELIVQRESNRALTDRARAAGMRTLAQSGWDKVRAGLTTLDELVRNLSTNE
ncbi:GspE/PulE family protein [Geminisphaera colitermitum]|uniref:GspE/PulE family protein n=1 Tax=Geminisphaera colitermitum TaxID=1148786 RepID=UPI0005BB8E60|nr:GspE/PulE family protein [Geminisphaera colitermitum]